MTIEYNKKFKSWVVKDGNEILTVRKTFQSANSFYCHLTGELFPYGGEGWPMR